MSDSAISVVKEFYDGWREYTATVRAAVARLTQEQLSLRAAENERSVGEIIFHMVGARFDWVHDFLGEGDGDEENYARWTRPLDHQPTVAELLEGLDFSWELVESCLNRWTPTDLEKTFPLEWRDQHYDTRRSWVIWHLLEHDLIHGGEVSLTLGMHGLAAPRP